MKLKPPRLLALAFCLLGVARSPAGNQGPAVPPDRYLLITPPPEENLSSLMEGGPAIDDAKVDKDSEISRFLRLQEIPKWKSFEDESVRFEYPDFPGLAVKVADGAAPAGTKVYGGPVGSVDRQAERCYTIGTDEVTWAILILQKRPWFDEGICLCGAVSLRICVATDTCLRSYDLLESGLVKKAQVLGDGQLLQVFEWTHLPMTQAVYCRFVDSVALKKTVRRTEAEWIAEFRKQSRDQDFAGWIKPGMKEAEIVGLMGPPTEKQGDTLVYRRPTLGGTWMETTRIRIPDGGFRRFSPDWRTSAEIPPEPGTLGWAKKLTDRDPFVNSDGPKISEKDKQLLRKTVFEQLKDCPPWEWNEWVAVADSLHKKNELDDKRLGGLLAARFLDPKVSVNFASILLGELAPPGSQELLVKRIRFVLTESAKPDALKHEDLTLTQAPLGDFYNLLGFIESNQEKLDFVREGLAHPHPDIRSAACHWLDQLPEAEGATARRKALLDPNRGVRESASVMFKYKIGTKDDLAFLREVLAREGNAAIRENLEKAIHRIESGKPEE